MMDKRQTQYDCQGVKPVCVQGRFFTVMPFADRSRIIMLEFEQTKHHADQLCSKFADNMMVLELPKGLQREGIIGKLVCIGCRDNLFVIQYITRRCKYLRFLLVNSVDGSVQMFEDTHQYFIRDFHMSSPVECLISPDMTTFLFRLPQNIMTCRKWSKLIQGVVKIPKNSHGVTEVIGTEDSFLRDRKFQNLVYDNNFPNTVIISLVDEFCSKCKFSVYNLTEKIETTNKVHRLEDESVGDSDVDAEETTYYLLHQCSTTICRSGEILVLMCVVTDNRQRPYLRIFTYNTQTLCGIKKSNHKLTNIILPLLKSEIFSPVFTVCDLYLQVWQMRKCQPSIKVYSSSLPKPILLKSSCRAVILRNIPKEHIDTLSLPVSLISYLKFIHI